MTLLVVIETLLLALLTLLVGGLLRSHAEILRRLSGPTTLPGSDQEEVGLTEYAVRPLISDVKDIEGEDRRRSRVVIPVSSSTTSHLLAFMSSGCTTCQDICDELGDGGYALPPETELVVVAHDRSEESLARLRRMIPETVNVVLSSAAWEHYRVPGSPYFIFIGGETHRIEGEGTARTLERALSLLRDAIDDAAVESAPAQVSSGTTR